MDIFSLHLFIHFNSRTFCIKLLLLWCCFLPISSRSNSPSISLFLSLSPRLPHTLSLSQTCSQEIHPPRGKQSLPCSRDFQLKAQTTFDIFRALFTTALSRLGSLQKILFLDPRATLSYGTFLTDFLEGQKTNVLHFYLLFTFLAL